MMQQTQLPRAQDLLAALRRRELMHGRGRMENRRRDRRPLSCIAQATFFESGAIRTVPIHTRDISTSGLGFTSPEAFRRGTVFAVQLEAGGVRRLVLARACFSSPNPTGGYRCGAEFLAVEPGSDMPASWRARMACPLADA